jgi:hypothetical protein
MGQKLGCRTAPDLLVELGQLTGRGYLALSE